MRTERPSEGWLVKAWDGEVLIDLIHHPAGLLVDDGLFERATRMDVMAQPLLVASAGDVLATKILALSEQDPNIRPILEIARSCASKSTGSSCAPRWGTRPSERPC